MSKKMSKSRRKRIKREQKVTVKKTSSMGITERHIPFLNFNRYSDKIINTNYLRIDHVE